MTFFSIHPRPNMETFTEWRNGIPQTKNVHPGYAMAWNFPQRGWACFVKRGRRFKQCFIRKRKLHSLDFLHDSEGHWFKKSSVPEHHSFCGKGLTYRAWDVLHRPALFPCGFHISSISCQFQISSHPEIEWRGAICTDAFGENRF